MLYYKTECPHCGNEINVNESKDVHKCRWCRRLVSVKFERGKGKKFTCTVEPMDFPDSFKPGTKSLTQWETEDVYGTNYRNRNSKSSY